MAEELQNPEDLIGKGGILKQLTAALVERCLNAEIEHHLEEEHEAPVEEDVPQNRCNGHSKKTIKGEFGEAEIAIPRDRNSALAPIIVPEGQTRFDGFDGKILSLHSRGMSVRDIQAQLQDLYGVKVSAGLISKVTDAVEEERKLWQNRTLDRVYPIVYFDAVVFKVRHEGRVRPERSTNSLRVSPSRTWCDRKGHIANIALSRQVSNTYHRENESLYQKNWSLLTICNDTVTLIYRT
ncbi:transposase [Cyanobacteria bacterium FACHB-DQ100]|nr:transposase [Cyanobacteria bacterium FACHB-DQ100]